MKYNKKLAVMFLTLTYFLLFATTSAHALHDLGEPAFWYADTSELYFWPNSSIKIQLGMTSGFGMTQDNFITFSNHAANSWLTGTGKVNRTFTTNGTDADSHVRLYGLARSDFRTLGLPDNVYGIGLIQVKSLSAAAGSKLVYRIDPLVNGNGLLYVCWDGISDKWSPNQWRGIFSHEFGHILGYYGHYNDAVYRSIMNSSANNIFNWGLTGPKDREMLHLRTVYSIR